MKTTNKMLFNADMKRKNSKKSNTRYLKSSVPEPTSSAVDGIIPEMVDEMFDEDMFDDEYEFSK